MTQLQVDLSALKGWSRQVDRASDHTGRATTYAQSHLADGDFGRILELITDDYEAMLPDFRAVLREDRTRLARFASALDSTRADFAETDRQVAQDFGLGARIVDSGASQSPDVKAAGRIPSPSASADELPEVSFGYLFDKCCDLIVWVGGPDPREYVTKWIAGDVNKASLQASAWDHLSTCLESVESNLNAGQRRIDRTWKGGAAANARTRTDGWTTALGAQSDACSTMASHLRDMVDQAVQMAQVVVDIIKTVVSLVSAALSSAYIPGWGQWKAIKTVRQGIKMVNDARKVITVFWNAITMVKDGIIMIANHFSITALPPAPAAGR